MRDGRADALVRVSDTERDRSVAFDERGLPGPARAEAKSLHTLTAAENRVEPPDRVARGCVERHQHTAAGAGSVRACEIDPSIRDLGLDLERALTLGQQVVRPPDPFAGRGVQRKDRGCRIAVDKAICHCQPVGSRSTRLRSVEQVFPLQLACRQRERVDIGILILQVHEAVRDDRRCRQRPNLRDARGGGSSSLKVHASRSLARSPPLSLTKEHRECSQDHHSGKATTRMAPPRRERTRDRRRVAAASGRRHCQGGQHADQGEQPPGGHPRADRIRLAISRPPYREATWGYHESHFRESSLRLRLPGLRGGAEQAERLVPLWHGLRECRNTRFRAGQAG